MHKNGRTRPRQIAADRYREASRCFYNFSVGSIPVSIFYCFGHPSVLGTDILKNVVKASSNMGVAWLHGRVGIILRWELGLLFAISTESRRFLSHLGHRVHVHWTFPVLGVVAFVSCLGIANGSYEPDSE